MFEKLRHLIFGAPKDIHDPQAFHKLSLVALLAWVGLGADGLSSSAYGPDEAFRAIGEHRALALLLAVATALTVFIISYGYSRLIEQFPSGGGGYIVATKLLGPKTGVVSGSALLVDYVLTITVSMASGADALFSFLPHNWLPYKLIFTFMGLFVLTLMNLRGVKESISAISPVFGIFLLTHAILLIAVFAQNASKMPEVASEVHASLSHTFKSLGTVGALALFMRAYSLGGGTYTGIEAVSNGLGMMREPRVRTARRTMVLMAASLAITAGGILLAYLLAHATVVEGKTMNAVLLDRVAGQWSFAGLKYGQAFIIITLVSEGALLFVAAQAGFLDGPRVMANMAGDRWLPQRFASLSEQLTMKNGVFLMGLAAAIVLIYTRGDVSRLVVMYAINVFLTFTLSNVAMMKFWIQKRKQERDWWRHLPAHAMASLLCASILVVTIFEKFAEGAWLTLLVTAGLTFLCFAVRRHYDSVAASVRHLDDEVPDKIGAPASVELLPTWDQLDKLAPIAVLFVGRYGGLGRHALLTLLRMFPRHFKGVMFVAIAVVDSDTFKGPGELKQAEMRTREALDHYVAFAHWVGIPASSRMTVATDVPTAAEAIAKPIIEECPGALFVAGQIVFERDDVAMRLLHNDTAFAVERRLQRLGVPMIVVPTRIRMLEDTSKQVPVASGA
jgi:amino acid transporter